MDKPSRLNERLTLIANIAVVLGIIFLALELRQNTEMMRAQTRAAISQAVVGLIDMERDPRLVAAYLRLDGGEAPTEEDRYLLDNIANATLRTWENTYYQFRRGLFDEAEFAADLQVWSELMQEPHFANHWSARRETYAADFRAEIDAIVAEIEGPGGV